MTCATEQYGIISGRSVNAEKEEATFNLIKTTSNTLNRWPNHVTSNTFIRIQVSEKSTGLENIKIIQTDDGSLV